MDENKEALKAEKEAAKADKKAEKAKKKLQKERAKKDKDNLAAGGMSKAEKAREKRKANMEKSNEKAEAKRKKQQNMTKGQKRARIITPIVVVVLAIAVFLMSYFGCFQRMQTAVKLEDGSTVSVAEYEYYYRSMYNYYYSMSSQYESYYASYMGEGAGASITGFDYTKTPGDQEFQAPSGSDMTVDEEYVTGDTATWADYFTQAATQTAQVYTAVYNEAIAAGYEMSEDENSEMEDFFDELRETAEEDEYSLDAYLRNNYGKGMTKGLLEDIYVKQTIASDYLADKEEEFGDAVTEDEIKQEYNDNKGDYTTVSLRYFNFSTDLSTDEDELSDDDVKADNADRKAKAEAFMSKATNDNFTDLAYENAPESYAEYYKDNDTYTTMEGTTQSDLASTINDEAGEWAYKAKVGDKTMVTVTDEDSGLETYYVLLLTEEPTRDDTYPVSVRHILFQVADEEDTDSEDEDTDSDSEEDEDTTHTDAEAKELAEDALKQWKDGDKTDDSFAELATSLSEDTGSAEDGGLYEDITPTSSYVQEFLDWCFEDGRKAGDTGIIKTEYGYHVMYCVEVADEPQWKSDIRSTLGETAYNDWYDALADSEDYAIKSSHHAKSVMNKEEKYAEQVLANASTSSSSYSY